MDEGANNNSNSNRSNVADMEEQATVATVVTNPSTIDDQVDDDMIPGASGKQSLGLAVATCPKRAAGYVCICDSCEAARTRLLDRCNKTSSSGENEKSTRLSYSKRLRSDDDLNDDESNQLPVAVVESTVCSVAVTKPTTNDHASSESQKLTQMSAACKTILQCIGEDPEREGLVKTPERWAKALLFMCHGYAMSPSNVTNGAVFSENHNEMVIVRNIDIHSLCEHHMVPFTGHVHIGYIPDGKILGLSKLARIAELYARRLQVQERLTRQIADAILETIEPLGVAVVIECTHFCMVMRGVQKTGAVTTTSSVRGCFETNSKTRAEFFSILHGGAKRC